MSARCADPNCSCRSPDLERFTNQVLRRDAARTDYIVIPLIAGVLANCFLADEAIEAKTDDDSRELVDLARAVRGLAADAANGIAWEDDTHAYGVIASLVFCNWPELIAWGSSSWYRVRLNIGWTARRSDDMTAAVRVLAADPPPSWTESVLLATLATAATQRGAGNDYELLGKVGRQLRVVLANRMRRANLVTWPAVLSAAVNDWTVPTLQQILRSQAEAGDAAIQFAIAVEDAKKAKERQDEIPEPVTPAAAPPQTPPLGEAAAAEELIKGAVVEISHWRAQRDRVQQERDRLADRDARHRSHIESLGRELESARRSQARAESQLATVRQERDQLAERVAGYEAVAEDAPSTAPAADTFAGRRVLVFTGAENAEVRSQFAESFRELGASEVDCYWADRSRGPDQFPPTAVVAIDVTFMSHSTWTAIHERARAAGAWCYWGKHGVATLSRATAAAWTAHLFRRGLV